MREIDQNSFTLSNWFNTNDGNPNNNKIAICNTVLLQLKHNEEIQKQFTINHNQFSKIQVFINLYLYNTQHDSTLNIILIQNNNQQIKTPTLTSISTTQQLCDGAQVAQFIFTESFNIQLQSFILKISFQINTIIEDKFQFLGIRDLLIYTDSHQSTNGCPLEMPLLSTTQQCSIQCSTTNEQLSGHYLDKCVLDNDSKQENTGLESRTSTALTEDSNYHPFLRYTEFESSNDYSSINDIVAKTIDVQFSVWQRFYLQVSIYLINWQDYNTNIKILGLNSQDSIHQYYCGSISYDGQTYTTSTQTLIEQGTIKLDTQSLLSVYGLQLNCEMYVYKQSFPSSLLTFNLQLYQQLNTIDATYLLNNVNFYTSQSIQYCSQYVSSSLQYYCISCIDPYWAYRGQCDQQCPPYTIINNNYRNCTDLSEYEIINNFPLITKNSLGIYLIKISEQDHLDNQFIESQFSQLPPNESNNYINQQKFTILPNQQLIGGYNSWGSGSFVQTFTSLSAHYQVRIYLKLYLFDDWNISDQFTIYIDNQLIDTITIQGEIGQQIYGLPIADYIKQLFYRVPHSSPFLSVELNCKGSSGNAGKASCGFTNYYLLIDQDITQLCPTDQFYSFYSNTCEKCNVDCTQGCQLFPKKCTCHYSCKTCNGLELNNCQSCNSNDHRTLVDNQCQCQSGYTDIGSHKCVKFTGCHYSCLSCFDNSQNSCGQCPSAGITHRIRGSNTDCICQNGYIEKGEQECSIALNCDKSCETCSKSNQQNSCLTCRDNSIFHRTFDSEHNTCPCDNGYMNDSPISQYCILVYPCHISCEQCSEIDSSNSCITCPQSSFRNYDSENHKCQCDIGYQEQDPINKNCELVTPCHYTCELCSISNDSNACQLCPLNSNRSLNNNKCECNTNYHDPNNQSICIYICHYTCLTCSQPYSSTNCETCPLNTHRTNINNQCICESGYKDDGSNALCILDCHYSCLTCSIGLDSNSCLSCDTITSYRSLGNNNDCPCIEGYEDQSNPICSVISPCHSTCKLCSVPNQSNSCIECYNNTQFRYLASINECKCQSGYSDKGIDICQLITPCHYSCNLCTDTNNQNACVSCISNSISHRTLIGGKCLCDDYYVDNGQSNCDSCHYSCLTCYLPNSSTQCKSCLSTSNRTLNQITLECLCNTTYKDIANQLICVNDCHYTCQSCFNGQDSNSCLTCSDSSHRIKQQNSCICQQGYNNIDNQQECQIICHNTCLTCQRPNSQTDCLSCQSNLNRILNNNNQCICESGYIEISNTCIPECHYTCLTCFKPQIQSACLTCISNRTLINNNICQCNYGYKDIGQSICQMDCHQTCLTCSEPYLSNKCLTCDILQNRILNNEQQCICKIGFNLLNNQCIPICHYTCLTCNNIGNQGCLSCDITKYRELNIYNQCTCQQGYSEIQQLCVLNCHYTCLTCFGWQYNQCLTCLPLQLSHRYLLNNQCICDMNSFNVNGNPICQINCMDLCVECNSKDTCKQCKSIDHLILKQDICQCENGYYFNNSKCLKCSELCETCINQANHCLSCYNSQNRILTNNECLCKSQFWMEQSNSLQCISCDDHQGWLNQQCEKQDCTDGLYTYGESCDDNNNNSRDGCNNCVKQAGYHCFNSPLKQSFCIKCNSNCQECYHVQSCYLCNLGFELVNGLCIQCPTNCQSCQNHICTKCNQIFYYNEFPLNSTLQCPICSDIDGLYLQENSNICYSKCGDSIIYGEECDDGNIMDGDGCSSQCKIEKGYLCNGNECIEQLVPIPIINQINPSSNYTKQRDFIIIYNQLLQKNITENINISIPTMQQIQDYQLNMKDQSIYINESTINYLLSIQIILNTTFKSKYLQITFKNTQDILGQNNQCQIISTIDTKIYDYYYYSKEQEQITYDISKVNYSGLILISISVGIGIIFGGLNIFWNLLDLLQIISYIMFIDTRLPNNLAQFLELFNFAQFNFLDQIFQLQHLMDILNIQQYKANGIFNNYLQNALFIVNIISTFTAFLLLIIIYLISAIINYLFPHLIFKFKSFDSSPFNRFILTILHSIYTYFNNFNKRFFWTILIRTHLSTIYDISFSLFIQLSLKFEDMNQFIAQLSYLFTIIIFLFQWYSCYLYIQKMNTIIPLQYQKQYMLKYGEALFDTINAKLIGKVKVYYNIFLLLKRIIYMFLLIFFTSIPQIQTLLITLLEISNLFLLYFNHPLIDSYEFKKQIFCNIFMYLIHFKLFILTLDDSLHFLNENGRINIGWTCITFISFIIFIQLVIDLLQLINQHKNQFNVLSKACKNAYQKIKTKTILK